MNTGGIQLRLGDFLYAILKRWKVVLALTFVGLVFGIMLSGVSYMQGSYTNYEVACSFVVVTKGSSGNFTAYNTEYQHPNDFTFAEDMVDTVNYVIKSDLTMNKTIDRLRMIGIKPKDIVQNLSISQYNSTPVLEITLTWRDAQEGVTILTTLIETAQETLQDTLDVGALSVIDAPEAKQTLSNTLGGSVWAYMMVLGFLAGVGVVILELLMRPTLTNLSDVETVLGLETLGTIPRDDKYFRKKTSFLVEDDIRSPNVTQNYSSAAFILRNRLSGTPTPHCFYVTSATSGEGKTMVAANLAIQLSDMEQKVLLIDLDTRNPSLGKRFLSHVDYDRSLNALYRGQATREESIFTLTGYLDLLPAVIDRQPITIDGAIFDLIKEISQGYDYVIMDTAPVGQVSETLSLNEVADTVLFVLKYDSATIPEIRSALEKLDKSGIRVLGCVVNAAQNVAGAALNEDPGERKSRRRKNGEEAQMIWEKPANEEPVELPERESEEKNDKKSRKKRRGRKGKQTEQQPAATEETASEEKPARASRNPLEELLEEEAPAADQTVISDSEAAEALFRLGIEGDWEDAPARRKKPGKAKFQTPLIPNGWRIRRPPRKKAAPILH